jgi:hypothetical protein
MHRRSLLIALFLILAVVSFSQNNPRDTTLKPIDPSLLDTSIDYDVLFDEMTAFLDSISSPHNYTLAALSFSKGYFNVKNKNAAELQEVKRLIFMPTVGYYHRSGFGVTGTGSFVRNDRQFSFYQLAASPSYDYLANKKVATGISYTRYFTKDSLSFYTSPLQNELYAYFTYRKWWFKPMVAVSYGWGSRSDYQQREEYITSLRLRPTGYTRINTTESVGDLSLIASVRHDFYWLDVFGYNDHIRITPQLTFTSGTQKFGFNQSSNTYATVIRTGANVLYSTQNVYLDNYVYFQPISLTFYLRTEYSIGKFYIQPQLILDYYFPASDKKFTSLVSLNTGFIF